MPEIDSILYIWGDKLSPTELTSMFGVVPTKTAVRGQINERDGVVLSTERTGLWSLRTVDLISSNHIGDHIALICDLFAEKVALLRTSGKIDKIRLLFLLSISETEIREASSWSDEIDLSTLKKLVDMEASLSLTILN